MVPTVHLNGTGSETLLEETAAALRAVGALDAALRQITVHGRDYYPQGPVAYKQARYEMDRRIEAVGDLQRELLALYTGILTQDKGGAR